MADLFDQFWACSEVDTKTLRQLIDDSVNSDRCSEKTIFSLLTIQDEIKSLRKEFNQCSEDETISKKKELEYLDTLNIILKESNNLIFDYDNDIRCGLIGENCYLSEFFEKIFSMINTMPVSDKNILINEICCLKEFDLNAISEGLMKIHEHLNETLYSLDTEENSEIQAFIKELLNDISHNANITVDYLENKISTRFTNEHLNTERLYWFEYK